jgi:hypothetical protein
VPLGRRQTDYFLRRRFFALLTEALREATVLSTEVLELRAGFQFLSQPNGLRTSSCPDISFLVAIFDRDLSTF